MILICFGQAATDGSTFQTQIASTKTLEAVPLACNGKLKFGRWRCLGDGYQVAVLSTTGEQHNYWSLICS